MTHQAILFVYFFISKVIRTDRQLNILGLEGNQGFLIAIL